MLSLRNDLCSLFPLKHTRHKIKIELQKRFHGNCEDCFGYVNQTGERLINKGIGLLTYDALLIASYTIPVAGTEGLSLTGKIGVVLSVFSALAVMCYALAVRWPRPDHIADALLEFTDYVDEVAKRTIAINGAVGLSILATVLMFFRVFC